MRPLACIAVSLALAGSLAPARADTSTSAFNVTASVVATCSISAGLVLFGSYTSAQLDTSGTITVSCTNLAPYTVALDAGSGSGASITTRRMTKVLGTATLDYSLYRDAGRTLLWGTTTGTNTSAGVGSGAAQAITVYGRIPSGQYPEVGLYSDTVTATITY